MDQVPWQGNKPYRDLNGYLRSRFNGKVFKIPVDAGFTCPNRDGSKAYGGCAFCGARGAGDFTGGHGVDLLEQFEQGRQMMHRKWKQGSYIVYLQAFSNTYGPAERLAEIYELLLAQEGVVGMAIATRPDCLPADVLELLEAVSHRTYLWVELGLQTVHRHTARDMNLGYEWEDFCRAAEELKARGIEFCAHIILGLPGESREEMMATALQAAAAGINGLKIHLFHLLKDSPLAARYGVDEWSFMEKDEYVRLVVDIIERIPPEVVIHRLTGDSPRDLLVGPRWSLNKWEVLNAIEKEFKLRGSWQGRLYDAEQVYKHRQSG